VISEKKERYNIYLIYYVFFSFYDIQGSKAILSDIPKKFSGTDALSHHKLTLAPGNDVQNVVSFKLDPKFQDGNLKAVCVENITPAEHITQE
jgi:hypothetical protein